MARPPSMADVLDAARRQAGLSLADLWLGYFSLGGTASLAELQRVMDGAVSVPPSQYDVIAQALNEVFVSRGMNHPVPYSEELAV